jgi:predicted DNA-binding protein
MMDIIDDYYLAQEVRERLNDGDEGIEVDLDEL